MAGRVEPSRIHRLRHLRGPDVPGRIQVAVCACGHRAPVPVDRLVKRYGDELPVDQALLRLRCARCGDVGRATIRHLRLCDAGCPRQRG